MRKRTLTADQETKRDARRAKFGELVKRIAAMSEAERLHLSQEMPVVLTIEGRALSLGNLILLNLQHVGPTIVGGFQQWKAAGRVVRKGESGLMIWAPTGRKDGDTPKEPTADQLTSEKPHFIMVTVFDISQTDPLSSDAPPMTVDAFTTA